MVLEYLDSTQRANKKEIHGSKENVKKEEINDRYSTIARAGDQKKSSETAKRSIDSMFRRSVKVKIPREEVENSECGHPTKIARKESNILSSPPCIVKKEEHNDNVSTMVLLDKSSPTSPVPHSASRKTKKKEKLQSPEALKFKDGAPDTMPLSPVSSPVHVASTSLSEGANKALVRKQVSISPSSKRSRNGTERNESRITRTPVDTVEHSIWESDDEGSHGDESSDDEDNEIESKSSTKRVVDNNTDDVSCVLNRDHFPCLDCAAVFETNAAFKVHIASHEGYRRYKCDACERRFINSGHLTDHMRRHTGEKPFQCHICQKRFTKRGDLTVHIRYHSGERPFKCAICQKGFAQSGDLRCHNRIHTGERPFKCAICQAGFVQRSHLRLHNRTHTGEKPYSCLTCGKCFTQSTNLHRHRRTHTDSQVVTRQDVSHKCRDQPSSMDVRDKLKDSVKIRYRSKSIGYLVEKMTNKNPDVAYVVWSKKFTMELASAVARSGYNCILCVKKIERESFRDVMKLSNNLHTCLVEIGPDSEPLRLFSFGGMILPEKITNRCHFKSLAKLESKMRRFLGSEGMELVNIFKHTEKNSGWYESLKLGLVGDCIISDKV